LPNEEEIERVSDE
jgi:hypothetical protein